MSLRIFSFSLLLITTSVAFADDQVLIAPELLASDNLRTGDAVSVEQMRGLVEYLYVDEPCRLDFAAAANMRRLIAPRDYLPAEGCWFPTMDGGFTVLLSYGHPEHMPILLKGYVRCRVRADGGVVITQPNFEGGEKFAKMQLAIVQREFNERMRNPQKPVF